jgi:uncharacterized protein (DUF362 family)
MEAITRRIFLKRTISSVGGVVLAKSIGSNISLAQAPGDMSRAVVVRCPGATDGVRAINALAVQDMMDESIKQLTGEASVAGAWRSILPGFEKGHIVAIKINANWMGGGSIVVSSEVVNAIVNGLTSAGVPENDIIVYDKTRWQLEGSGYQHNAGELGVRCFGNDENGWGYDWDNPVEILGQEMALSSIVTRCDHLINVPVLKNLPDIWQGQFFAWGVTLSLKNHYGSVSSPSLLHDNFPEACATLNSQDAIKDKTRLVVMDSLFGHWRGALPAPPDFAYNGLIVCKDPVAADHLGTEIINEERAKHNQPPREVPVLEKAAQMGLGTNDPGKMELLELELQAPEWEKADKSVDPSSSYKTRWGNIKVSN